MKILMYIILIFYFNKLEFNTFISKIVFLPNIIIGQ